MPFDKVTENFYDGFEGSINEHCIFTEDFFGNDQGKTSKKCLVTGAINFQRDKSKPTDALPSLDGETSGISSQLHVSKINGLKENFGPRFLPNKHATSTRDDIVTSGKRIKLSLAEQSVFSSVTGRLAESTTQGIVSSSYLLKGNVSMHSLPSFHENDEKKSSASKAIPSPVSQESLREHDVNLFPVCAIPPALEKFFPASKTIPSPVSQESFRENDKKNNYVSKAIPVSHESFRENDEKNIFASKTIPSPVSRESFHENDEKNNSASKAIPSPVSHESFHENADKKVSASTTIPSPVSQESTATKSPSLRTPGKRTMKPKVDNLSSDKVMLHKDGTKDPRPLLREYIQNILRAAGWEITKRKRPEKANGGYIYKSPQTGRLIREFTRVWNLSGLSLSIDRARLVLEDGKQWNDMTSFWSDLSLTLSKIDEESSLAQQWCLLDPFANLVFIEKKLGLLKAGKVVEAKTSLVNDSHGNEGAGVSSKNMTRTGNKSKKGSSRGHCESSLIGESVLTNIEASNSVSKDSCGTRNTVDLGLPSKGTVKALDGVPLSLSKEKCTLSGTSDHSSSCLNEVPVTPQNVLGVFSDSVSPPQDGSINSQVHGAHMSNYNEQMASEVDKTLQNGSSRRKVRNGSVDSELVRDYTNLRTPQSQSGNMRKRSKACEDDDKLLISAVIRKKTSRSLAKRSTRKAKPCKLKPKRKCNTEKGGCRLLRRGLGKGGKNEKEWYISGLRTVLSWLINVGTVSLNEVIECRDLKDNAMVKVGLITRDGILCTCCNKVISVSGFKFHAGFRRHPPSLNLVMSSGKPFTSCQLEAWSDEYRTRKSATRPVEVEDLDQNDDSCGLCGEGGELICCENCPSTFHQRCLCEQEFPEGDWYCQYCTCRICGDLVNDKDVISTGALKCLQCEHKYHEACVKEKVVPQEGASEAWFCGESCQEVYLGLQSQVGALNYLSDGFSWTLLRCIDGDQKVHSAERLVALKAECNLKLAVALTIMEECFLSMVDPRTGIDMIPHVLYNWESEFARLNYHGFYTMVLEKDDVLISAASIRIHGVTVAEMPLIATCSKYRRQGMCRRLMDSIEEMLKSFKVEKLVITAIPDVVETWTVGFGFEPLEDHERKSLSHINLMVFPGSVWLKKTMYNNQAADEQMTEMNCCSDGMLNIDSARPSFSENGIKDGDMQIERDNPLYEDSSKMCDESALIEGKSLLQTIGEGGSADMFYERELLQVSRGEEPTSEVADCQLKTSSNMDTVAMDDERKL